MNKDMIARNFSRYAHLYDEYATIQRIAADELIKELPDDGIRSILELGCGTGIYTSLLKGRFKAAYFRILDISAKMIEVAKNKIGDRDVEFIISDAEAADLRGEFNLITSNAAFQWFEDLKSAVGSYKDALAESGLIAFSIFGPSTFWELNQSLKYIMDESITADGFLGKMELEAIIKSFFSTHSIREKVVEEEYPSLLELLKKIKYTGARGSGLNGSFMWKRGLIEKIENIYKQKFGRIVATYQVFFCKAIK